MFSHRQRPRSARPAVLAAFGALAALGTRAPAQAVLPGQAPSAATSTAQPGAEPAAAAPGRSTVAPGARSRVQAPPFRVHRQDEDYRYLRDGRTTDPWDGIKYIPLDAGGHAYASLGGEVRPFFERFANENWGRAPRDRDGHLLQRYMLHADLHAGDRLRAFAQFKTGVINGRTGGARPPDRDDLDLHQGFVDVGAAAAGPGDTTGVAATLRVGRQELEYGAGRLVSVREGPNVRQSFDAVRAITRVGRWHVDALASRPVETAPGSFDDHAERGRRLWGVYGSGPQPWLPGATLDVYYLGYDRRDATFDQGSAREQRHTGGFRLNGRSGSWDYDGEGAVQWGTFGTGRVRAWTASHNLGYTFGRPGAAPRVALGGGGASGDDDRGDRDLQLFNPLFPRGAYFGQIGQIGALNFIAAHPSLDVPLSAAVQASFDYYWFWRESLRDGVYSPAGALLRTGQASRARFVGSQPGVDLSWQVDRHLSVAATYAHFFAGRFLREAPPAGDIDYVGARVTYRF